MKITIECTEKEKRNVIQDIARNCFLECPEEEISCLECVERTINWKIKENKRGNNSRI